MAESNILKSVKKVLSIGPTDTSFDEDLLIFVNSAFSTLQQLGVPPIQGFFADENSVWDDFFDFGDDSDPINPKIKTYICLKTRISFDPPTTSYMIEAMERQIAELEGRIREDREFEDWRDPEVVVEDG